MASVLIVHSDNTTEMWAASLRAKGFAVHRVCNPEEAFAYINEHPPAVIVTDSQFRMSAFNGATFIRAVRERKACALSRIIVCSGQTRVDDERPWKSSAASDPFALSTPPHKTVVSQHAPVFEQAHVNEARLVMHVDQAPS